jgi:hypothetical protein
MVKLIGVLQLTQHSLMQDRTFILSGKILISLSKFQGPRDNTGLFNY